MIISWLTQWLTTPRHQQTYNPSKEEIDKAMADIKKAADDLRQLTKEANTYFWKTVKVEPVKRWYLFTVNRHHQEVEFCTINPPKLVTLQRTIIRK